MRTAPLLALALAVPLMGFMTGAALKDLKPGMSPVQAEALLGKPNGFRQNGTEIVNTYLNKLVSGWDWTRTDYFVRFQDGKLVEWGSSGNLRTPQMPSTLFIVPLHR